MTTLSNRLAIAAAFLLIAAGLTACSSAPVAVPAGGTSPAAPVTTPSASVAPQAAGGLNACAIVTEALVQQHLGIDPGPGVAVNADTCKFKSAGGGVIITAQSNSQPDLYLPANIYSAAGIPGAIDLHTGMDRGYYQPPAGGTGNGGLLVVKNGKGVWIVIYLKAVYTGEGVLALANAIAAKL